MSAPAAARRGLAPDRKPQPDPLDPRLRPWWERCKQDSERLAKLQGERVTTYQAKLQYQQTRQLLEAYRLLASDYAALLAAVTEVRAALRDTDIQLALPLPELRELPEPVHELAPTKRGSKAAAAL